MIFIRVIICFLLFSIPALSHATAQEPDFIFIGGKKFELNTNPLQRYIEKNEWQPPEEARIWSSNWRGYIASWEISKNKLMLKDVTIRVSGKKRNSEVEKSILWELFSSKKAINADWYSGALIISEGDTIHYVHMGYGSTYERYQIFHIQRGEVVNHLSITADEFVKYRSKRFEVFSRTDEFKKSYEELKNNEANMSHEEIIDFMYSFHADEYLAEY